MNGRPAMDTDGSGDASFEEWLASTWSPGGATTLPARSPGAPHHFTDTCPFCHLFERVWPDAAPRLACPHACAHTFRAEEENDAEMGACACACVCVQMGRRGRQRGALQTHAARQFSGDSNTNSSSSGGSSIVGRLVVAVVAE